MKCVKHHASRIGECVCLDDVHAPGCEYAGNSGKKRRPIRGKQRQREAMPFGSEFRLQRRAAKLLVYRKVPCNLSCGVNCQIAPRESFEESFDIRRLRARNKTTNLLEH